MISVIIPTFNEEKYLGNLFERLSKQSCQDFEVIVADNNSTDKTIEIAKKFGARVVLGGIQSVGRNNGAKVANFNILFFIDADITFNQNFLEKTFHTFLSRDLDIGICKFSLRSDNLLQLLHNLLINLFTELRQKTKKPLVNGGVIIIKKDVFFAVGGFDENLKISEDRDLVHKSIAKSFRFRLIRQYFHHSSRRYKKVKFLNIFLAGFIVSISMIFFKRYFKYLEKKVEKMYGGFGDWN